MGTQPRVPTIYVLSKNKKNIKNFHLKISFSKAEIFSCVLYTKACFRNVIGMKKKSSCKHVLVLNIYPLISHFIKVKMWFTGIYIYYFSHFC